MAAASIFMYLMRYIGIMALLPIAFVGLYCLYQRRTRDFFLLAATGLIIAAGDIGYMQLSLHLADAGEQVTRHANQDSISFLLRMFALKQLEDVKLLGIAALLFAILYTLRKPSAVSRPDKDVQPLWPFLLLTGVCYVGFMLLYRMLFLWDNFGTRMQIPGTLLLTYALLEYSALHWRQHRLFAQCFAMVMIGCFLYQAPIKLFTNHNRTYAQQRAAAEALYAPLPAGSIILAGDMDTLYLRHDIQPASPYPYVGTHDNYPDANGKFREDIAPDETLAAYIKRRCTGRVKAIYVDASRWDVSINNADILKPLIAANPNQRLLLIANCKSAPQ
jgi:hypothetical protein